VIRTLATAISLPPGRTFSAVMVANPRLTSPAITLASKPMGSEKRLRHAVATAFHLVSPKLSDKIKRLGSGQS
jgi:hypothetical protein